MVDTVTVPFAAPLQDTLVLLIVAVPRLDGWVIVTLLDAPDIHPFASLATTE